MNKFTYSVYIIVMHNTVCIMLLCVCASRIGVLDDIALVHWTGSEAVSLASSAATES